MYFRFLLQRPLQRVQTLVINKTFIFTISILQIQNVKFFDVFLREKLVNKLIGELRQKR